MIKYEDIIAENFYTTGFEVSTSSLLGLSVNTGVLTFIQKEEEYNEDGTVTEVDKLIIREYPAIEFDIEFDNELTVSYDIYLLEEKNAEGINIHVDRTEMTVGTIPFYENETPQIHCLMSLAIPPKLEDLSNIDIIIRNVLLKENVEKEGLTT